MILSAAAGVVDDQRLELLAPLHGAAELLDASDRAWLGKPQPPPARAMWRSLFLAAAKVEVVNVWLCKRACGPAACKRCVIGSASHDSER